MAMPNSLAIAFTERQNKHAENFEALLAKAEDRKPADFVPMGTDQALPGISVITPAAPVEVVSKKEPAITKAPQPKPTEKTVTPTANTALEQPPEDAANASQNTQPKVLKSDPFSAEAKALKEQ